MDTTILKDLNALFSDFLIKGASIFELEKGLTMSLSDYQRERDELAADWASAHFFYHNARLRFLIHEAVRTAPPLPPKKVKTHDVQGGRGGGNSSLGEDHDRRIKNYETLVQQVYDKEGDYKKIFANRKARVEPLTIPIQYREMTLSESNAHALFWVHNEAKKLPVVGAPAMQTLTAESIVTKAGDAIVENYLEGLQDYFIKQGEAMANTRYGVAIKAAETVLKWYNELDSAITQAFAKSPQLVSELEINLFEQSGIEKKIELISLYNKKYTDVLDKSTEYIKYLLGTLNAGSVPITETFITNENKIPAWSNKRYYLIFVKLAYVANRILKEIELIKCSIGNAEADKVIEVVQQPFAQKETIPFPPHSSAQVPAHKIKIDKDILNDVYEGLLPYFEKSAHKKLLSTLNGSNSQKVPLVFNGKSGKQFCEVFRRLIYNLRIDGNATQVAQWIVFHFEFIEQRNNQNKGQNLPFTFNNVINNLTKDAGDIRKEQDRICNINSLKYYTPTQIKELKK